MPAPPQLLQDTTAQMKDITTRVQDAISIANNFREGEMDLISAHEMLVDRVHRMEVELGSRPSTSDVENALATKVIMMFLHNRVSK